MKFCLGCVWLKIKKKKTFSTVYAYCDFFSRYAEDENTNYF